jgi:hypothetical protein
MPAALEAGKVLGILLLWLTSYVCGKKRFEQPQQGMTAPGTACAPEVPRFTRS